MIFRLLVAVIIPLLLSIFIAVATHQATGATLGLFIGPVVLLTLIIPFITLAQDKLIDIVLALSASVAPVFVVWFIGARGGNVYVSEWLNCCLIALVWSLALAALTLFFKAMKLPATLSASLSVMLGLFWITWPIWASSLWSGSESANAVGRFINIHPIMLINAQVHRPLGMWTEQSIAYHLTDLSQNVPFTLPKTMWAFLTVHGLLAALCLTIVGWFSRTRNQRACVVGE